MRFFDITQNEQDTPGRLLIKFPFELSANFKSIFSGESLWHHEAKLWSVPVEARQRLEEWIQLVRKVEEHSRAASRQHLTELEIERVNADILTVTDELKRSNAARDSLSISRNTLNDSQKILDETLKILRDRKEELALTESALHFEREQAKLSRAAVDSILSPIIDLPALREAFDTLRLLESTASTAEAEKWREAQLEFIKARDALENAGVQLEAISYLAEYRDKVRKMPPAAWYTVTRSKP